VLHGDHNQLDAEPRYEPGQVTRAAEHGRAMQELRVRADEPLIPEDARGRFGAE